MSEHDSNPGGTTLPTAELVPRRRLSLAWALPLVALIAAGGLIYRVWSLRGVQVTIQLKNGHGLRPGDEIRFRGITVGEIDAVDLEPDLENVLLTATLIAQSETIAVKGTQFWVVRPSVSVGGVTGLETVVGPRYLTLSPGGTDQPRRFFVGLDDPPIVAATQPGDLEIIVQAAKRGSLRAGAPVTYRQVRVGSVLSVGLASDASAVEARLHIEQAYASLIREHTRFWDNGGVEIDAGLTGVNINVDSLSSLVLGGVALAAPPPEEAGEQVRTGFRFIMAAEPQEEWLEWEPVAMIGSSLLPPGLTLPRMERAALRWESGPFSRDQYRGGWLLQVERGVLGPGDLLLVPPKAKEESARLDVAGRTREPLEPRWSEHGVTVAAGVISAQVWPRSRMRDASDPEDCAVVADPTAPPMPLSASRLTVTDEGFWIVDEAVSFSDAWHGGCVVSRGDGALIGVLLVEEGVARIALLPRELLAE